jgi:transcriptional regulator with XRE-family HTH domain
MKNNEISRIFSQIIKKERQKQNISLEEIADRSGLHRTSVGLIEKGERNPTIDVADKISSALDLRLSDILMSIENEHYIEVPHRQVTNRNIRNESKLFENTGLDSNMLIEAINHCYHTLDLIDKQLVANSSPRLANLIELANLSSIIGNVLGAGISIASEGLYKRNKPHSYPDLLPQKESAKNLELKMALEMNKPKGHLPKEGFYIIFRYVLGDGYSVYKKGKENRGDVVWIWEVKVGHISENDFLISNTPGDSGKTAVIKTPHFNSMPLVYYDYNFLPYSSKDEKYPGFN